ncbi:MAG: sodium:solute symporter family transporter [Acidobacteriota bacterium]
MPDLAAVDWMILLIYFFFTISIGLGLRQSIAASGDFLLGGRVFPAWLCGLALAGASLGSLEVLAMGAAGARYGWAGASFFALGSVVPLVFAGLFMTPTLRASQARSMPDYLRLRFDAGTRGLSAWLLLFIAILGAALGFYAMARVSAALHLFDAIFHAGTVGSTGVQILSVALPTAIVLVYVLLGGLSATMYTQVMQFFVLFAGFLPMVFLGLKQVGGWSGLHSGFAAVMAARPWGDAHPGSGAAIAGAVGLGILLTAGYWCTEMSVMQTALAAENVRAARRAPLIAAATRVFLPFILVLPGMIAISLPTPHTTMTVRNESGEIFHEIQVVPQAAEQGRGLVPARTGSLADPMAGAALRDAAGHTRLDYGLALPNLLPHNLPNGLLGLALTALLACLTGGVAGRISAFASIFTHDVYQPLRSSEPSEKHLLAVGRWAVVGSLVLSAGLACAAMHVPGMPGVLDLLALLLAVGNAPMLATFLLGMFWKRATSQGAFAGIVAGYAAALLHYGLTVPAGLSRGFAGGWIAPLHHPAGFLAQNAGTALAAMVVNAIVTVAVSLSTAARPEAELTGLVHSLPPPPPRKPAKPETGWKRPEVFATLILLAAIAVGLIFI